MRAIKNYSTVVPAGRSLAEIQAALVRAGASTIMTDYDRGRVCAIHFLLHIPSTGAVSFKLPVEIEKFRAVLLRQKITRAKKDDEYVQRVAWRCVRDWVLAQLALCETEMADPAQVFLPYAVSSSGATLYEIASAGEMVPLLTAGEGR